MQQTKGTRQSGSPSRVDASTDRYGARVITRRSSTARNRFRALRYAERGWHLHRNAPRTAADGTITPAPATLVRVDPTEAEVPKLPKHPAGKRRHPETKRAWRLVHESPMFPEYDESDVAALFRYAVLVDAFWTAESEPARVKFSAELRMVSQSLGLTPLDRRRLSWGDR